MSPNPLYLREADCAFGKIIDPGGVRS